MKRLSIATVIGLAILTLTGCVYTQANLNVRYAEEDARKGPLSSVRPLNFEVGEFIDKRSETDKIGYKRDGFGQKTAKIVSMIPVPQIIQEAIITEFEKNGHIMFRDNRDILLSGIINYFWFDSQMNFWTVEFMGTVSIDLNVSDAKTGTVLLTRSYQGYYNEKSMGGLQ